MIQFYGLVARLTAGSAAILNEVFNQPPPPPPSTSDFAAGDTVASVYFLLEAR